jgi:hypothetical protein
MRGDHIFVKRTPLGGGLAYTHHGVDLGDGRVVHYSGEPTSAEPGRVVISRMEDFLLGGKASVRRYKSALSREETVRRALSRLGEEKYNIVTNNCEHFATWCRTGESGSKQVAKVAVKVGKLLGGSKVGRAVEFLFKPRRKK